MLAIILGILKCIGTLILVVLGVILMLILLVLLVPIRYRAEGSYYGKLKGSARVSWLLTMISLQVSYEEEADIGLRVFGIRIGRRKRDDREAREAEAVEKPVEAKTVKPPKASDKEELTEPPEEAAPDSLADMETDSQKTGEARRTQKTRDARKGNPFKKIRVTFRRFCDKLKALKDKKEAIMDFIRNEENQRTFRLLKKQIFALLKHILPRKIQGLIRFGFDDPYTTGQVLTYVSPFYGLYARKLQLIPMFEEQVLEGEGKLKGRIRIGTVLVIGIRVLLDKNFRSILKKWREA